MHLPRPRGPISERLSAEMATPEPRAVAAQPASSEVGVFSDEDTQIALWALYELSYRGFDDVDPNHEWSPALLETRAQLEAAFEAALRALTDDAVDRACEEHDRTAEQVLAVIEDV